MSGCALNDQHGLALIRVTDLDLFGYPEAQICQYNVCVLITMCQSVLLHRFLTRRATTGEPLIEYRNAGRSDFSPT